MKFRRRINRASKDRLGEIGEQEVLDIIDSSAVGKMLNNLYIPIKGSDADTEIDTVFICRKGILVFESKNWQKCSVYGNMNMEQWEVYYHGDKKLVYSPSLQNDNHIKHLAGMLDMDFKTFVNVLVFGDTANTEKVSLPYNVYVSKRSDLAATLKKIYEEREDVLSDDEQVKIYNRLKVYAITDLEIKEKHKEDVLKLREQKEKEEKEAREKIFEECRQKQDEVSNEYHAKEKDLYYEIDILKNECDYDVTVNDNRLKEECSLELQKHPEIEEVINRYDDLKNRIQEKESEAVALKRKLDEECNKVNAAYESEQKQKIEQLNAENQKISGQLMTFFNDFMAKWQKASDEHQMRCSEIKKKYLELSKDAVSEEDKRKLRNDEWNETMESARLSDRQHAEMGRENEELQKPLKIRMNENEKERHALYKAIDDKVKENRILYRQKFQEENEKIQKEISALSEEKKVIEEDYLKASAWKKELCRKYDDEMADFKEKRYQMFGTDKRKILNEIDVLARQYNKKWDDIAKEYGIRTPSYFHKGISGRFAKSGKGFLEK